MSLFSSDTSSAPAAQPGNTNTGNEVVQSTHPAPPSLGSAPAQGSAQTGFTLDDVKKAVPSHIRNNVTQSIVDNLNTVATDPIAAEDIRNNFISYTAVLKEGRFKLEDYLNAVTYVSYKVMGNNNEEAYAKTFPQRYAQLISKGTQKKDIASYVSSYNKGKLVNMILEQTLVPTWVLNQDIYQQAINHQAFLMKNANSEKVQQDAANSLLTHLAKPKEGSFQINIGETENAGMREMRDMLREVAMNQREAISTGRMQTVEVANQKIREEGTE